MSTHHFENKVKTFSYGITSHASRPLTDRVSSLPLFSFTSLVLEMKCNISFLWALQIVFLCPEYFCFLLKHGELFLLLFKTLWCHCPWLFLKSFQNYVPCAHHILNLLLDCIALLFITIFKGSSPFLECELIESRTHSLLYLYSAFNTVHTHNR